MKRLFYLLYLALLSGGIALFAAGYLAIYLPPRLFWWAGLPASFLPYLSVLIVIVSLLGGIIARRRWLVALAGFFLVLMILRFSDIVFSKSASEREDDLVLMTFNAPVRGPSPEALQASTLELVREASPDLLALQEPVIWREAAGRQRATPHLQAILDSLGYHPPLLKRKGKVEQPVVATVPIRSYRQIELRGGTGDRPAYVTRVEFAWQGRRAVLYNVHLYTTSPLKPWNVSTGLFDWSFWRTFLIQYRQAYLRRAQEARKVRRLVEQESLPVIVTGDFNSTPYHWEHRFLSRGLRDAYQEAGQGLGGTYHSHWPLFHIDHVLVGPAWKILNARVVEERTYSDHRPVLVRLRWRDRP